MRSTIIATLCFLAPVLSTPIPMVLVDSLESVAGAAHPPAPVAAARPKHALPEFIFDAEDKYERYPGYDNSHMDPSPTMTPSQVLDAHEPLETQYLLSLHPGYRRKMKLSAEAAAAAKGSSIAAKEMGMEELEELEGKRIGMPCYYAKMARIERNDLLAVCLILLFAVVVVFVETFASAKRFCSKRGAIRLQEDEPRDPKQPLSVRADTTGDPEPELSEKPPI